MLLRSVKVKQVSVTPPKATILSHPASWTLRESVPTVGHVGELDAQRWRQVAVAILLAGDGGLDLDGGMPPREVPRKPRPGANRKVKALSGQLKFITIFVPTFGSSPRFCSVRSYFSSP